MTNPADKPPEKLGKYKILRVLGKGAMGIVYEGVDPVIQRRVAIKTIHKALLDGEGGQELLARFQREAQAAGRLMHPNIVGIYEYGEELGIPYIAMEFIEGRELKDYIKENTRFDISQIVSILTQTLSALQYCHTSGVIHRDLKPANIILLKDNQVKIADFGIARVESSTMTQLGAVMGTPSYMSPEQFMGQRVDNRADLFSIGCILYELLTGEKPFPGAAVATIMHKVLNAQVENPTDFNVTIPNDFNSLVRKALAKRPNDRFQSAQEMSEAIKLAAQGKYSEGGGEDEGTLITPGGRPGDDEATMMGPPETRRAAPQASSQPAAGRGAAAAAQAQAAAPPPAPEKKFPVALVAAGVAGLLLVGGGGAWFMAGSKTPDTPAQVQDNKTGQPTGVDTQAASQPGLVNATSNPPGAVIMVNDQYMGVTPYQFEMKPGEYQVVLKKDGFYDLEASLVVEPGKTLNFNVPLTSVE